MYLSYFQIDPEGPDITCVSDCYVPDQFEILLVIVGPLFILVTGSLLARRWRELPLVALAAFASVFIVERIQYHFLPILFWSQPSWTLDYLLRQLVLYGVVLIMAAIPYAAKRAVKALFGPRTITMSNAKSDGGRHD